MKKVGDYLVYRKDVCKVIDIVEDKSGLCYILVPVSDQSLKIKTSVTSDLIRDLISKDELDNFIKTIPSIPVIDEMDKLLEVEYKNLMRSATPDDLVKIIKTTYLRNEERLSNKKKTSDKDTTYFNQAEKYLYTELAVVLDMSFDDAKNYITDEVKKLA